MAVLIFANGDLAENDWVRPFLSGASMIIAANGGSEHLWRLKQVPDLIIGDLDSISPPVLQWLRQSRVKIIDYPEDKDETDLELALQYALQQSLETIYVFAAAGGRLDQTLANIQLLAHPDFLGRRIELVTANERAWLVAGQTEISGRAGDLVSLVPLGGDVQVDRTEGLQWPLIDEVLQFGPARGISNIMTADSALIFIDSGTLLCIHTPQSHEH